MRMITQRDFKDCGVTCMEYIIKFYHGYIPIEKLREDTFTSQEGTTAFHIVETFKKYNFDSFGKKIAFKDLNNQFLPAIVHIVLPNGLNHFVVLTKVKKEEVTLMDPMIGKKVLSKDDFIALWDGIILLAIPEGKVPKIDKETNILASLIKIVKREKALVAILVFCNLIVSFLTIIHSFYLKISLTTLESFNLQNFLLIFFIFLTILFFRLFFFYYEEYLKIHLNKNIEITYLYAFFKHLFSLSIEKFLSYHEADILTRINNAVEIKNLFQNTFINFALNLLLFLLILILAFFLNLYLTLVLLAGMLLYFFISFILAKDYYIVLQKILLEEKNWQAHLLEMIQLFLSMKHFNNTNYGLNVLENKFCHYEKAVFKTQKKVLLFEFIKNSYLEILSFLFISIGLFLIIKGKLELLNFITFQSLYFYFINPLKELADIGPKFYYLKAILLKMTEMIHLEEEDLKSCEEMLKPFAIKVEKLSFSYNGLEPVLKNVSLTIKAKEHVFLTAKSGHGKSTLCKLLHGEYLNYNGNIYFDKQNLKDYKLMTIRESVVYSSQQEKLYSTTIKENILFGQPETNFTKVCEICNLESIVSKRALRYESKVDITKISGGERQRILLARALMKEASLYLLDECLSEVDEQDEIDIIKKVRKYLKGKTLIYISHKRHDDLFERSIIW